MNPNSVWDLLFIVLPSNQYVCYYDIMKRLIKIFLCTGLALYITSIWNKGFILPTTIDGLINIVVIMAVIYYLIVPISKIVLFPLNLLTMGMVSFLLFVFLIHMISGISGLMIIKPWEFPGISLLGIAIPRTVLSYPANLLLSSLSFSGIITILQKLI